MLLNLPVGSMDTEYSPYAESAGVTYMGLPGDPEDFLVADPDLISLNGAVGPEAYYDNPIWRGLKAVKKRQVYREAGMMGWILSGSIFEPIEMRWLAEVAHPDKLKPKVRDLLYGLVLDEYGVRLTDDQIDALLNVKVNAKSTNNARFARAAGQRGSPVVWQ